MQFDPAQLLNSGTTGAIILLALIIYRMVTARTDSNARGNVAKSYSDIMGAMAEVGDKLGKLTGTLAGGITRQREVGAKIDELHEWHKPDVDGQRWRKAPTDDDLGKITDRLQRVEDKLDQRQEDSQ